MYTFYAQTVDTAIITRRNGEIVDIFGNGGLGRQKDIVTIVNGKMQTIANGADARYYIKVTRRISERCSA